MSRKPQFGPDDLRPEYDFDCAKAVRGKYYHRLKSEGSNIVVLEPDVARSFRDSAAVKMQQVVDGEKSFTMSPELQKR
jgi:hypothetical protein